MSPPLNILLVEDNPGDVELVREGFRRGSVATELHVLGDGVSALGYLRSAENPTPDLVLLDINLPRKNGHEVLAEIKADQHLRMIPVLVLTTSQQERDVRQAYRHSVNAYLTKPSNAKDFLGLMSVIEGFWLSVVNLPRRA